MSDLQFVQYVFMRLDPVYHNLESNERIVAKQAFLGTWESFQSRALLVSWALTGLRADCDVLCLRAAHSLELLQDITCRLQSSGLGRFLVPAYSFLARATGPRYGARPVGGDFIPGQGRYLFFSAWSRGPEWRALSAAERTKAEADVEQAAKRHNVRLHPGLRGLDEAEDLTAAEVDTSEDYLAFADELKALRAQTHAPAGPAFVAVSKDIRDQADALG